MPGLSDKLTVGVIGALGVGRAHAIAAVNNYMDLVWVADTADPELLSSAYPGPINGKLPWLNSWEGMRTIDRCRPDIAEGYRPLCISLSEDCRASVEHLLPKVDLVIIATPDATHIPYLKAFSELPESSQPRFILCEKPVGLVEAFANGHQPLSLQAIDSSSLLSTRTFIGYKYNCRSDMRLALMEADKTWTIRLTHTHNYPPVRRERAWNSSLNVLTDLGSHDLALLLPVLSSVFPWTVTPIILGQNLSVLHITTGSEEAIVTSAYNLPGTGTYRVQGSNLYPGMMIEDLEVIINDKVFGWKGDEFEVEQRYFEALSLNPDAAMRTTLRPLTLVEALTVEDAMCSALFGTRIIFK